MCAWSVCCHKISTKEQHSSSTTAAVFQALGLASVVTVHVCVVGAQQEVESRQYFTSNATIKHTCSDLMPGIRSMQQ